MIRPLCKGSSLEVRGGSDFDSRPNSSFYSSRTGEAACKSFSSTFAWLCIVNSSLMLGLSQQSFTVTCWSVWGRTFVTDNLNNNTIFALHLNHHVSLRLLPLPQIIEGCQFWHSLEYSAPVLDGAWYVCIFGTSGLSQCPVSIAGALRAPFIYVHPLMMRSRSFGVTLPRTVSFPHTVSEFKNSCTISEHWFKVHSNP